MKKLTRLISVLMLIAMCFSLMSVCASAEGVVVVGGSRNSSSETDTIKGAYRYQSNGGVEDNSTGKLTLPEETETSAAESSTTAAQKGTDAVTINEVNLDIWAEVDKSYPNVEDNKDQILYVLNGYAEGTISKGSAQMVQLNALFGEAVANAIEAIDAV